MKWKRTLLFALIIVGLTYALHLRTQQYSGPMGTVWGQSPKAVKRTLSKSFTFIKTRTNRKKKEVAQIYQGSFSGFDAVIEAIFFGKKFSALTVMVPTQGKPASQLWDEIRANLKKQHGEPSELHEPPQVVPRELAQDMAKDYPKTKHSKKVKKLLAQANKLIESDYYQLLDKMIIKGEWEPRAVWTFDNNVGIAVTVFKRENKLLPVWIFAKLDVLEKIAQPE